MVPLGTVGRLAERVFGYGGGAATIWGGGDIRRLYSAANDRGARGMAVAGGLASPGWRFLVADCSHANGANETRRA